MVPLWAVCCSPVAFTSFPPITMLYPVLPLGRLGRPPGIAFWEHSCTCMAITGPISILGGQEARQVDSHLHKAPLMSVGAASYSARTSHPADCLFTHQPQQQQAGGQQWLTLQAAAQQTGRATVYPLRSPSIVQPPLLFGRLNSGALVGTGGGTALYWSDCIRSALPGSQFQPTSTGSSSLAASNLDHGKDGAPAPLPGALQPPHFAILHGAVQLCAACSSLPGAALGLGHLRWIRLHCS